MIRHERAFIQIEIYKTTLVFSYKWSWYNIVCKIKILPVLKVGLAINWPIVISNNISFGWADVTRKQEATYLQIGMLRNPLDLFCIEQHLLSISLFSQHHLEIYVYPTFLQIFNLHNNLFKIWNGTFTNIDWNNHSEIGFSSLVEKYGVYIIFVCVICLYIPIIFGVPYSCKNQFQEK